MASNKRPTAPPSTPQARKKATANRPPSRVESSYSSTVLRPEFQNKGFFFEHNINPDVLGDHESIPFAKKYIVKMKMEAIYAPPDVFYPTLVHLFLQNISFPEMDDVPPFVVASIIGKTKVVFTPEEMADLLGFPDRAPRGC